MTDTPGRLLVRKELTATAAEILRIADGDRQAIITRVQLTNTTGSAVASGATRMFLSDDQPQVTLDVNPAAGTKNVIFEIPVAAREADYSISVGHDAGVTATNAVATVSEDGKSLTVGINGQVSLGDILDAVNDLNSGFSAKLGSGNSEANADNVTWSSSHTAATGSFAVPTPADLATVYRLNSLGANSSVTPLATAHPIWMVEGNTFFAQSAADVFISVFGYYL